MDEWNNMGNDTYRRDYSNYIYGIIADKEDSFEAGLYNCAGFECKMLAKQVFSTMQTAAAFLDAESLKHR